VLPRHPVRLSTYRLCIAFSKIYPLQRIYPLLGEFALCYLLGGFREVVRRGRAQRLLPRPYGGGSITMCKNKFLILILVLSVSLPATAQALTTSDVDVAAACKQLPTHGQLQAA